MDEREILTALINRIKSGDISAIDELILNHRRLVVAAIRYALEPGNSLRPVITTKDILQSVNLRLMGEARKATPNEQPLSPPSKPIENGFGWLITVATHLVIDYSRKLLPKSNVKKGGEVQEPTGPKVLSIADLEELLTDPAPGPDAIAEHREAMELIFGELSPEERAVLEERNKGMSWDEIGKEKERPTQRRIKKLKKRFQTPKEDNSEQ